MEIRSIDTGAILPNNRQVGGDHYKGSDYQHWDWVTEMRLPYLTGTATKYIYRWRRKNGVEDLQKAIHYIDKCEEVKISAYDRLSNDNFMQMFWRFVQANNVGGQEAAILWYILRAEWEAARLATQTLISQISPEDQN